MFRSSRDFSAVDQGDAQCVLGGRFGRFAVDMGEGVESGGRGTLNSLVVFARSAARSSSGSWRRPADSAPARGVAPIAAANAAGVSQVQA